MKTRPCKPGDIVVANEAPCGAKYEVSIGAPNDHPRSGVTDDHSVDVWLHVFVPSNHEQNILSQFQSSEKVMGYTVNPYWGITSCGPPHESMRVKPKLLRGIAIAPLVEQAKREGDEALAALQAIVDAHDASRQLQENARNNAYAAFPVADTE